MENNKQPQRNSHKTGVFVLGLALVVAGLMLVGRNLGFIDNHIFRIVVSWQSLLIVLGLLSFRKGKVTDGLLLTGIGAFFLIPKIVGHTGNWIATYWPLILVLVGLNILFKTVHSRSSTKRDAGNAVTEDGYLTLDNSFGNQKQIVLDKVFKGATIKASFSGTVLDLRRTDLEPGVTIIVVEMTCCGLEIYVPDDWNVEFDVNQMLSGTQDKRLNPAVDSYYHKKLLIKGSISLSGIEIKN